MTVAAGNASSANDGFLRKLSLPLACFVPFYVSETIEGDIWLQDQTTFKRPSEPLDSQAWTSQEFLSHNVFCTTVPGRWHGDVAPRICKISFSSIAAGLQGNCLQAQTFQLLFLNPKTCPTKHWLSGCRKYGAKLSKNTVGEKLQ